MELAAAEAGLLTAEGMGFTPGRPARLQTMLWSLGIYLFSEFNDG